MQTGSAAIVGNPTAPVAGKSMASSSVLSTEPIFARPSLAPIVSDRVELSDQSKNRWGSVDLSEIKSEKIAEPDAKKPGRWEETRLSQLDRLELLIQKGQYNITPFMVDEIALRLARSMILA